jgi:hypothetical protein
MGAEAGGLGRWHLRRSWAGLVVANQTNTGFPVFLISFCLILSLFMHFNLHSQAMSRSFWKLPLQSRAAFPGASLPVFKTAESSFGASWFGDWRRHSSKMSSLIQPCGFITLCSSLLVSASAFYRLGILDVGAETTFPGSLAVELRWKAYV